MVTLILLPSHLPSQDATHAQNVSRWQDVKNKDDLLTQTLVQCQNSTYGEDETRRAAAQQAMSASLASALEESCHGAVVEPAVEGTCTEGHRGGHSPGSPVRDHRLLGEASGMAGHVIVAGATADMSQVPLTPTALNALLTPTPSLSQFRETMAQHVSGTIEVPPPPEHPAPLLCACVCRVCVLAWLLYVVG